MAGIKNKQPIGVFDSGVGGLSVLRELKKLLPRENFVFLADQKYVPYGEKTREELVALGFRVMNYFVKHHSVKLVVVACNTSTCNAIGELRKRYLIPIVGTVPAVKPAAKSTKTKTIGVISTPSTSKSAVLSGLIKDYCAGIKVINVGCKNLEDAVELGLLYSEETKKLLQKYLKAITNSKADQIVLGCTHYPFLRNVIKKIVGKRMKLIDGNRGIARQTELLLLNQILENNQNKAGKTIYFTTGDSAKFSQVASKLLRRRIVSKQVEI